MWVVFVVGSCLALRVFLWVLWFFSLLKNQHCQTTIPEYRQSLLTDTLVSRSTALLMDTVFNSPFSYRNNSRKQTALLTDTSRGCLRRRELTVPVMSYSLNSVNID